MTGAAARSRRSGQRRFSGACLILLPAVQLLAEPAQAAQAKALSIPSQRMSGALQELARQAGVNILFLPGAVRDLSSRPVAGLLTPDEAARRMVAGTNLKISQDRLGSLIVGASAPATVVAAPPAVSAPVRRVEAPAPPQPSSRIPANLDEIVVTAMRQPDTLMRVPLSVSAETQRSLDQRGMHTIQDFQTTVPAVRVTSASGAGVAIVAIRGVVQTGATAATTGYYLDDVPLQRRSGGSAGGVNGTPQPVLFDLDRVEVLRGPQGTLFGSGSEGGTIRLIQPQPGLFDYSAYVRTQVSATHHGDPSGEFGVAVGGPIVTGKLGFRASAFQRRSGGFIDLVDPFTSRVWLEDANRSTQSSARLALAWAPRDNLRITASVLSSNAESRHSSARMTLPVDQPIVIPALCYDTRGIEALPISSPDRQTPVPIGRGQAECDAARAAGRLTHQTPGYTLGPYDLGPFQAIENDVSSAASNLQAYTLDLVYEGQDFKLKSILGYVRDSPKQNFPQPFQVDRVSIAANLDPLDPRNARIGSLVIPSGVPFIPFMGPEGFKGPAHFTSVNPRYTFTHELRLSSRATDGRLSWVVGAFYSNSRIKPDSILFSDSEGYSQSQFGISDVQRYGVRSLQSAPGTYDIFARVQQTLKDEESALFGEVNYWPTDRLKVIAGLRVSWIRFSFHHVEVGLSNGVVQPTVENGGFATGSVRETPITPRLGLQYVLGGESSLYVTAAKGYRGGGVNTPVAQAQAADGLARNFGDGFTVANLPRLYASDSVWSYEAGAKLRLSHAVQVNSAVYIIDWRNPQTSTSIPQTGASVTTNAERARSIGLEIEAQAALSPGLELIAALGANRAEYTRRSVGFVGFNGREAVSTLDGQRIAAAPMTFSFGARKNFVLLDEVRGYARADWRYSAGFDLAPPGAANWSPDGNHAPSTSRVNLRLGVEVGDLDVNLFVNNLLEPRRGRISGGRVGCLEAPGAACAAYVAFEAFRYTNWGVPREIGLQIAYRR